MNTPEEDFEARAEIETISREILDASKRLTQKLAQDELTWVLSERDIEVLGVLTRGGHTTISLNPRTLHLEAGSGSMKLTFPPTSAFTE